MKNTHVFHMWVFTCVFFVRAVLEHDCMSDQTIFWVKCMSKFILQIKTIIFSGNDLIQLQNIHEQKVANLTTIQQQKVSRDFPQRKFRIQIMTSRVLCNLMHIFIVLNGLLLLLNSLLGWGYVHSLEQDVVCIWATGYHFK
jgi:hypothetical protein